MWPPRVTPLNIPDAYEDDRFDRTHDQKTGYRTRSILCMPVLSPKTDNIVAVVQLLNKLNGMPFNEQDERSFKEFAESLGVILESCNSFYVAARNQKGVSALLKAISSLEQSLDLEKTLQSVMEEARQLMQADRSTLWLIDEASGELWSKGQIRRWQIPGGAAHSQHYGHCRPCGHHRRSPQHSRCLRRSPLQPRGR
jgi:adenylate cyclase